MFSCLHFYFQYLDHMLKSYLENAVGKLSFLSLSCLFLVLVAILAPSCSSDDAGPMDSANSYDEQNRNSLALFCKSGTMWYTEYEKVEWSKLGGRLEELTHLRFVWWLLPSQPVLHFIEATHHLIVKRSEIRSGEPVVKFQSILEYDQLQRR